VSFSSCLYAKDMMKKGRRAPETSTPAVSYLKAAEIVLYNAAALQVTVWARCDTHTHLSSRFAFLNKTVSFPSVIIAAVMTGGTFFTGRVGTPGGGIVHWFTWTILVQVNRQMNRGLTAT
jgi:hypothetical protein